MKQISFLFGLFLLCVGCSVATPKLCSVYKGVLPAADGPGIATQIHFKDNGTFVRDSQYIGAENGSFQETGTYQIHGDLLTLTTSKSVISYRIETGQLRQLDVDKNVIAEPIGIHYVLASPDSCE